MPSLIPSRIVLRHSNVQGEKPAESDLLPGEVYLNIPDNKLYYKNRDSITSIIEINLNTSNDLTHVRDVNLSPEGNLIAVYSDNETKSLGSVVGPPGRGLAIDGVVDYVDQLPDESTIPPIPNILNKNGTLFIVRLGEDSGTLFDPTGPRIYAYTSADGGSWDELEGATVAAGVAGPRGNTIISGTAETPSDLIGIDGDYYLDTVNYVLFGPKSAGAWPLTGVNIQGPVGADGAQGEKGDTGEIGPEGPQGLPGPQIGILEKYFERPYFFNALFPPAAGEYITYSATSGNIRTAELSDYYFSGGYIPDGVTNVNLINVSWDAGLPQYKSTFPMSTEYILYTDSAYQNFEDVISDLFNNSTWNEYSKIRTFDANGLTAGTSIFSDELQNKIETLITNHGWVIYTPENNYPNSPWQEHSSGIGIANKLQIYAFDGPALAYSIFVAKGSNSDGLDENKYYACLSSSNDPNDWFEIFDITVADNKQWPKRDLYVDTNGGKLYYTRSNVSSSFFFAYSSANIA